MEEFGSTGSFTTDREGTRPKRFVLQTSSSVNKGPESGPVPLGKFQANLTTSKTPTEAACEQCFPTWGSRRTEVLGGRREVNNRRGENVEVGSLSEKPGRRLLEGRTADEDV